MRTTLFIILIFTFIACNPLSDESIKKTFLVTRSNIDIVDTLIIERKAPQLKINYEFIRSMGNIKRSTSVDKIGFSTTYITPEGDYLDKTRFLSGTPEFHRIIEGDTLFTNFQVDIDEELTSNANAKSYLAGKTQYKVALTKKDPYVIITESQVNGKEYNAKYYYLEDMGVIYYSYDFGDYSVEIDLSEISIVH